MYSYRYVYISPSEPSMRSRPQGGALSPVDPAVRPGERPLAVLHVLLVRTLRPAAHLLLVVFYAVGIACCIVVLYGLSAASNAVPAHTCVYVHYHKMLIVFGWHCLSDPACLMRPRLFYASFVVSRITTIRHIVRRF